MSEAMDTGAGAAGDQQAGHQQEGDQQHTDSSAARNGEQVEKEEKKPRPFVGLMANSESVVSAVCRRDMDLVCSLLDKLQIKKQLDDQKAAQEVQVTLELGHEVTPRAAAAEQSTDPHSHDFSVFVRAPQASSIQPSQFIDKVVFNLSEQFIKPKREVCEFPYIIHESSSEDFEMEIEIYFKKSSDPKCVPFKYEVCLMKDETNKRCETVTFKNVASEFMDCLIKAGAVRESAYSETPDDPADGVPKFPKLPPKSEISQAIMVAITTKQAPMLDRLLEAGKVFSVDLHIVDQWCPLICTAAELGDMDLLRVVLKHSNNIAVKGHYGNILHSAIRSGNYELVQLIMSLDKIDVKEVTEANGSTVLMDAVRSVRLAEVTRDDNGLDERAASDGAGHTCPVRRSQQHDLRTIRDLLARGVAVDARDKCERTALHHAAMQGHADVVQLLLEHGADRQARDEHGKTPWMEALFFGHAHLYEHLEDLGAINALLINDGGTLLHFATEMCSPSALRYLLSKGADQLIANGDGRVPLVTAIRTGNSAAARILAQCRPNGATVADNNGMCAIHHAVSCWEESGRTLCGEMAALLLEEGADVDLPNERGQSALLEHVRDVARLEWLLQHGANPDYTDPRGLYPLLAVCDRAADPQTSVRLLLKHHVDMMLSQNTCTAEALSDSDHAGLTPLQIAVHRRDYDLTRLLLAADACLNQVHDWLAVQLNPGGRLDGLEERWHALFTYIRHRSHQPMGLKGICRIKILQLLGHKDVERRVTTLGLPVIMQSYLAWNSYITDRLALIERFTAQHDS